MLSERRDMSWEMVEMSAQYSNSGISMQQRLELLGRNLTKHVADNLPFAVDTGDSPRPITLLKGLVSGKGNLLNKAS